MCNNWHVLHHTGPHLLLIPHPRLRRRLIHQLVIVEIVHQILEFLCIDIQVLLQELLQSDSIFPKVIGTRGRWGFLALGCILILGLDQNQLVGGVGVAHLI